MLFSELLIKLSLSLLLGLLIGIDRQMKHKPLGLRTSMVICVASCLLTIVSIEHVSREILPNSSNIDPMRLAAQIVSGVGFLGAGVILRRNNDVISGLTTAAMIWAASGLGIAVGAGFYTESFFAVGLILFAVNVIPLIFRWIGPSTLSHRDIGVKLIVGPNAAMREMITSIEHKEGTWRERRREQTEVRHFRVKDLDNGNHQISMTLSVPNSQYTVDYFYKLKKLPDVLHVEIDERS